MEIVTDLLFWAPKSLQMVTAAMKFKTLAPWKKTHDKPRHHIELKQVLCHKASVPHGENQAAFAPIKICTLGVEAATIACDIDIHLKK